jgi:PleD family two-component response regulator
VRLEETKPALLIVEDDLDIADMLTAYFRGQGYDVLTVNWGEDGIRACQSKQPGLVILDIRLPDIDGFEVARRLRSSRKTANIPIIFLTEKRERSDKLRGLELKADDYITKPFDMQELRLRVHNMLVRSQNQPLSSPVTGLPTGALVEDALQMTLTRPDTLFTLLTINNIQKFRDVYGFVATDDLLRAVSLIVDDIFQDKSSGGRFLGHLQSDNFVMIIDSTRAAALKERIQKKLDPSFNLFYSIEHRSSGLFDKAPLAVCFADASAPQDGFADLKSLLDQLSSLCH